MSDRRYGDYGRSGSSSRWRDDSIFSSDDRGRGRDDDRGFFDRAGDEVRSWFGDDEAERRRERDARRDEAREAFGRVRPRSRDGRDYERSSYGSGRRDEPWGGGDYGYGGGQGGYGLGGGGYSGSRSFGGSQAGYGENRNMGGRQRETGSGGSARSDWDDNYLRWRNRQIEQLDREYDEYCRHRQQQFESDFHGWRESRKRDTGQSGDSVRTQGSASGSTADLGKQGAGATTTGGGTGSATESSTGTSNRPGSRSRAGSSTRSSS